MPLPPYMKRGDMAEDDKKISRSVFAKKSGAVASTYCFSSLYKSSYLKN